MKREPLVPIDDAVRLTMEVADALDFAHTHNVIHRDIKPENILQHDGHAVVADYGIARAMRRTGGDWTTAVGMMVGSPAYMSPEQSMGDRDLDGRADIYSLASVLYEMLAGRPPFTGRSAHMMIAARLSGVPDRVRTYRPDVSQALETALAKALERAPADRFASAGEFGAALAESIQPHGPEPKRKRWPFGSL
jgi:serine/threonine-protein kinase